MTALCRCGLSLVTRANRTSCEGCGRASAWCRCQPVSREPEWRRWTKEHGSVKDMTGRVAA